jgi:hypothetical protein
MKKILDKCVLICYNSKCKEEIRKEVKKMFEVIEITETAWGDDEIIRDRFDTLAEAETFIAETYGDDIDGIYVQDSTGEVVWG